MLSRVQALVLVQPLPKYHHNAGKMIQDEWLCELSTQLAKSEDDSKDNVARHLLPLWLPWHILVQPEVVQEHVGDLNPKPWLLLIHPLDNLPHQVASLSLHLHDVVIHSQNLIRNVPVQSGTQDAKDLACL
jgi:hypothetical protein